jgi:hypothetical protein
MPNNRRTIYETVMNPVWGEDLCWQPLVSDEIRNMWSTFSTEQKFCLYENYSNIYQNIKFSDAHDPIPDISNWINNRTCSYDLFTKTNPQWKPEQ